MVAELSAGAGSTPAARYDAFLSYSHSADRRTAIAVQAVMQDLGRRSLARRPALAVFRDDTSLSADANLWYSIVGALESSRFFVLLACPEAATSQWVAREVEWWLEHRSADTLFLALTGGDLVWGGHDFTVGTSALAWRSFGGVYRNEPLWVDLRFARERHTLDKSDPVLRDEVAALAAPMHDMRKDELESADLREQRRRRSIRTGAVVGLAVLLVVALVMLAVAVVQGGRAQQQSDVAVSRQVAATATSHLDTDLDTAELLAVAAFRRNPDPETRAALMHAALASPHLVGFLPFPAPVVALDGSQDGTQVAAGLQDGRLMRSGPSGSTPVEAARLPGPVTSVALSADGRTAVAAGGKQAVVVRDDVAVPLAPVPGLDADTVAISPSGRTAAVYFQGRGTDLDAGATAVVDTATGRVVATHPNQGGNLLRLSSDDELTVLGGDSGLWERRRVGTWALLAQSSNGLFGTHDFAQAVSGDGRSFTMSNDNGTLPVWTTAAPSTSDRPAGEAQAPVNRADALALSPDGTQLAVADGGTVYVAPVTAAGGTHPAPLALPGGRDVTSGGLHFLGDGSHLVSASGTTVALWDLRQLDRTARVFPTAASTSCNACASPRVVVSPDGARAATVDGFGESVAIQPLVGGTPTTITVDEFESALTPPVWNADSGGLVLPVSPPPGGTTAAPAAAGGEVTASWQVGAAAEGVVTRRTADGHVAVLTRDGAVLTHDAATGLVVDRVPAPAAMAENTGTPGDLSADATYAAVLGRGTTLVVERASHRVTGVIPGDVTQAAYAGTHLLLQRPTGEIEVWNLDGTVKDHDIAGDPSYTGPLAASPTGALIARQRVDTTTDLVDAATGLVLGTLPSTSGASARKTGTAFTPDGRTTVSVTEPADLGPSTMVVRDLSDDALVAQACRVAGRSLTAPEWQTLTGVAPQESDLTCR